MTHYLKTIGHATLIVLEDDTPLIATDPWLVGSNYWRSWWLEKYPTPEEIDLVRNAKHLYITHSHPDHFHLPSLRYLGKRVTLHPLFPDYAVPRFMESIRWPVRILEPWQWYQISQSVRIASIPVPIDDSLLIIDTPGTTIANLNDANPRRSLLSYVRDRMLVQGKPLVALKSYSPASIAVSTFRNGRRDLLKSKRDYAEAARRMAETLNATHFVPFASQAFFQRKDSNWANEYKVVYEDLCQYWGDSKAVLCEPFVHMNLENRMWTSSYSAVKRSLDETGLAKIRKQEVEEASFRLPDDFDARLKKYLDEVYFVHLLFRRGIGWKLSTSNTERFYRTRTRALEHRIPTEYDVIITLPDKVLIESLEKNVLTDIGISMFIRVDTKVHKKLAYMLFLLMGLHDYGHFNSVRSFTRFTRFYLPYLMPAFFRVQELFLRVQALFLRRGNKDGTTSSIAARERETVEMVSNEARRRL